MSWPDLLTGGGQGSGFRTAARLGLGRACWSHGRSCSHDWPARLPAVAPRRFLAGSPQAGRQIRRSRAFISGLRPDAQRTAGAAGFTAFPAEDPGRRLPAAARPVPCLGPLRPAGSQLQARILNKSSPSVCPCLPVRLLPPCQQPVAAAFLSPTLCRLQAYGRSAMPPPGRRRGTPRNPGSRPGLILRHAHPRHWLPSRRGPSGLP